jgi:alkanesulfonate monooxygenase SsuD/methylene tetrahydromethanopterin reductase-like flavin-dependent oxidoreductase (luciferase family)
MKAGIAATIRILPSRPQPLVQAYQEHLEGYVLADELGFSHIWLAEHHFADDAHNCSAMPILAAVAARTQRIRVGTYIILLAFHHPILVAEDAATLDLISNGRFDLAVGAGPMPMECDVFGISSQETFARTYEALEVIQKCWTEEVFSHHGKYFHFDNVRMTTKPVQRPHPPILMAAGGPQSAHKAAERGYGLAMGMGPGHGKYVESLRAAGRDPQRLPIVSGPIGIHLADTAEQAWDEAEEPLRAWLEFYRRRHAPFVPPVPPAGEFRRTPNIGFAGMPFFVGTVEEIGERLRAMFHQAPLDEMALYFHLPGIPFASVRKSMTLFARHILPELRSWGGSK